MSMGNTFVNIGGYLLGGSGMRGVALIESERTDGVSVFVFVAGKTAEQCKNNLLERRYKSARVIAFNEKAAFRQGYFISPGNVVDMADLRADGFQIYTYPASENLFLIPDEKPTPVFHDSVAHRVRSFVGYDLLEKYQTFVSDEQTRPQRLTPGMVKDVFSLLNLDLTDEMAEKLSFTESAGGSNENMSPESILSSIVGFGRNAEILCVNGKQFNLFSRRDEFFPSAPVVENVPVQSAPSPSKSVVPRLK